MPLIKKYAATKNIFGVCLGMQAIVEAFGGTLKNLKNVQHGISLKTIVTIPNQSLYLNMPNEFLCGRYHSWVADEQTIPDSLMVTAVDESNNIMSVQHKKFKVLGVQFHPESVLTENGLQLISNWLNAVVNGS